MNQIPVESFRTALTPGAVRALQVIHGAIAMGVVSFGAVVAVIYSQMTSATPQPSDVSLLSTLTIVHVFVALSVTFVGRYVADLLIARQGAAVDAAGAFDLLRKGLLIRLASMEGGALFGLVVLIIGSTNGVLRAYPAFTLNAVTALALVGYIVVTFPTADRLEELFRSKFQDVN